MKNIIKACIAAMMIYMPLSAAEKMTIAIMDFQAQDMARSEALKISELIRNEMVNSSRYTVLERTQVDKILREQGFQMTGCTDVTCAVRVGKLLSARKILVGTVMKFGNNLTVTGRVVDVEKGVAEFAEKERALSKEDEFYMVERFCDKLTLRITGKPLYKKEDIKKIKSEKEPSYINYKNYSNSYYDPGGDPTLWLGVVGIIGSGVGFFGTYVNYRRNVLDQTNDDLARQIVLLGLMFNNLNIIMAGYLLGNNTDKAFGDLRKERDTGYIVSGSIGGFAVIMFATFIGRYVYNSYAVNKSYSSKNVMVFIPPRYFNVSDWINRKPGFGLGMSIRF